MRRCCTYDIDKHGDQRDFILSGGTIEAARCYVSRQKPVQSDHEAIICEIILQSKNHWREEEKRNDIVYASRNPTSQGKYSRSRVVGRRSWYEGVYIIVSHICHPSSYFNPTKRAMRVCHQLPPSSLPSPLPSSLPPTESWCI